MTSPNRKCTAPGRLGIPCEADATVVVFDPDGLGAYACANTKHQAGASRIIDLEYWLNKVFNEAEG